MKRALVLGSALAVLAAAPAAAQTEFGIDASVYSSYVWRGLHLSSKPVLQPDAWLSFPLGGASLTVGGWANVELGKYDGADDISEGGGQASLDLTEFDWWGEVSFPAGVATITGGATGYIYPNDAGLTKDNNTVEVYGKLALDVPLSPKISAYYDVDKIKGLYVEGSVSHDVPLGATALTFGVLAGVSAGQEVNTSDPSELANFNESGLTHIDLSASTAFSVGSLSISPSLHLVHGRDEFTKFTNLNDKHDVKLWGGVTISWSKLFGGSAE